MICFLVQKGSKSKRRYRYLLFWHKIEESKRLTCRHKIVWNKIHCFGLKLDLGLNMLYSTHIVFACSQSTVRLLLIQLHYGLSKFGIVAMQNVLLHFKSNVALMRVGGYLGLTVNKSTNVKYQDKTGNLSTILFSARQNQKCSYRCFVKLLYIQKHLLT